MYGRPAVRFLFRIACACFVVSHAGAQDRQEAKAPDTISWDVLRSAYDYDPGASPSVQETPADLSEMLKRANAVLRLAGAPADQLHDPAVLRGIEAVRLSFKTQAGESVPGLFLRPKKQAVYPCALLLHGLGSSKEGIVLSFGLPLVKRGVAVLALDSLAGTGRRRDGPRPEYYEMVRAGVLEYRRGLDYLASRRDVDSTRVGLIGYSLGSMQGAILGGVDQRIAAFALCVGGDMALAKVLEMPKAERPEGYTVCPSLYIGRIAPRPVLMINAKQDTIVSQVDARRTHDAAKKPKKIVWADSGHALPPAKRVIAVEWLAEHLRERKPPP